MHRRKSLLLVTVDCLRADHVGFMGYERPTTPFLNQLAQDSFVIPAAIVAGAPTYYSLPGILASRFPLALGRDVVGLAPGETSLSTTMQRAGFATACFSAGNPYISRRFGYEQGFDIFHDFLEKEAAEQNFHQDKKNRQNWASRLKGGLWRIRPAAGFLGKLYEDLYFEYCQRVTPVASSLDALRRFPSADALVDEAIGWLSTVGNAPFFLWLHFMDPHAPYYPKTSALAFLGHGEVKPSRARYLNSYWNRSDVKPERLKKFRHEVIAFYDAGIRWVDEQLARLAHSLQVSRKWDDCVFALTADHGEEFLEHDGRYHAPLDLAEELIHVPLLVRVPGEKSREQGNSPFSLIHLAPTLLETMGIPIPSQFRGKGHLERLLSGHAVNEVAISECVAGCTNPFRSQNRNGPRILSLRERRFKIVVHCESGNDFLYDLESPSRDRQPIAPHAEKTMRRHLLEIARKHLAESNEQKDAQLRLRARLREIQLKLPEFSGEVSKT